MAIPHSTGHVRSGDVTIHFRKLGNPGCLPLLIVHGLSYCSWDWLEAAQILGADREVVAMDMRGFGDSDWSANKDYSVPTMGQDIIAVLDCLDWGRGVLAGHSMGGRSTTYAAASHGDRVAGLALIDYSPENAPSGAKRTTQAVAGVPDQFGSIQEAMRYFGAKKPERFEHYLKPVDGGFSVKRDTHFRDQFRKVLETGERPKLGVDMWQLIREVRCPILSLRGSRSDMYAPETMDKMRAANAGLRVVEVDAGHDVAGDNLSGFVTAVGAFLSGLEVPSHAH